MNFSFRQLKAFLAVARYGSFTKAAEQLHITQAGLSAMIRELEEQAACRLFDRTTRAVSLTTAGQRLLPVAERSVHDLSQTIGELGAYEAASADRLKVGVTPLMASYVVPEVLRRLRRLAPGARVEIFDVDRVLIQQGVESGELDAGFGAFFSRVSGIRRSAIFPATLMLAVPDGENKDGRPVRWRDVDPDSLIVLPPDNAVQKMVDKHLGLPSGASGLPQTVTHLETALALVGARLGHAVVPSFVSVAGRRWRVRLLPIEPVVALDYYFITRSGRPDPPLVAQFAREFRSVVQALSARR